MKAAKLPVAREARGFASCANAEHGQNALISNGLSEVAVGRSMRSLKVVAAINQIVRVADE